jgi:hypothetical protein
MVDGRWPIVHGGWPMVLALPDLPQNLQLAIFGCSSAIHHPPSAIDFAKTFSL